MVSKYSISQTVYCVINGKDHKRFIHKGEVFGIHAFVIGSKIVEDKSPSYKVTGCGSNNIPEWCIFDSEEEAKRFLSTSQKYAPLVTF